MLPENIRKPMVFRGHRKRFSVKPIFILNTGKYKIEKLRNQIYYPHLLSCILFGSIWESTTSLCMDYTNHIRYFWGMLTQLTFNCSKSTTETLEKGVKYVQS